MRGFLVAAMVCLSCGCKTALHKSGGDAAADAPGTGGMLGSGGRTGSGGAPGAGGADGTGGSGQPGAGGASGGATTSGGTNGTGGAAGASGTTATAAGEGGAGRGGSTAVSGATGGLGGGTAGGSGGVGGATQTTGGAAGATSEPRYRVLTEASQCGGFSPVLSGTRFAPKPPATSYCDASLLRWICSNSATGGLAVQLTRLEYQCCASLSVSLVPEGEAYRLTVSDLAPNACNCVCVFDVQAFVARPCQPTTILWEDRSFALPIEDGSSGEILASNAAASACAPLPSQSSNDTARALAGRTATFTVTRTWVYSPKNLIPEDSTFVAVADPPPWTLVFSDDASSVTVSQKDATYSYTGTRIDGDPLVYRLSPATGGDLVIVARGSGYSAEIVLYGSGLPVTGSYLGELVLGS